MTTDGDLSPGVRDDLSTLVTARSLQRHTEWVSQAPEEIPGLLQAAGFTLVGAGLAPTDGGGQGYVARRGDQLVIAFRGSKGERLLETLQNVRADIDVRRERPDAVMPDVDGAAAHEGFYREYLSFQRGVRAAAATAPGAEVFVTGHSLGSAIATHCAVDLAVAQRRPVTLICSGTPRVGNRDYAEGALAALGGAALRVVLHRDPVPRLPLHRTDKRGFWHLRPLLCLEADGSPTPLDEIDGDLSSVKKKLDATESHDRDLYKAALTRLVTAYAQNPSLLRAAWGPAPFFAAGDAEAKSVAGLI